MKKHFILAFLTAVLSTAYAQNIVKNSDFNANAKKPGAEFRTNGGQLTVFTEENTGNRCGKLAFNKMRQNGKYQFLQAAVWIGGKYPNNNTPGGFKCKPNTTYDFSIDIKNNITTGSRIRATVWNAKQTLWYGKTIEANVEPVKVSSEWTTYKGSFCTKADSITAALTISIINDGRYSKMVHKVGDYILFDNVVIKERTQPADNIAKTK